ncbi:META domain-containing protein [Deinococcus peraridilitoris]|uniref:Heat shock protein n=1 Tax=Deinococcus peraridilitoris (strain DSM 19664 / LMG 22246 / CIP 109416 / KR-200) TaxID=937777 RepID=L0A5P0_DEIPD|nr:META domain-containing protein [Deinococcus peraridilitoris]AFZ69198.1 heat shock protein [Deinococcus peraridilitoris DSM 19664]
MTFRASGILVLACLCGHAAAQTTSSPVVQNGSWTLYRSGKAGNHHTVLRRGAPTIQFDGVQIRGTTGCNAFSSSAQLAGTASSVAKVNGALLSLGPVIVTRRACANAVEGNLEASFLKSLGKVKRYARYQNLLVLYTSDRESLIFRRN